MRLLWGGQESSNAEESQGVYSPGVIDPHPASSMGNDGDCIVTNDFNSQPQILSLYGSRNSLIDNRRHKTNQMDWRQLTVSPEHSKSPRLGRKSGCLSQSTAPLLRSGDAKRVDSIEVMASGYQQIELNPKLNSTVRILEGR
jgi:hypothetical protein